MGRQKKQDGPGRPQWVSRRDEVRLSIDDERLLQWWQNHSEEGEKGRAYRRALVVLKALSLRAVTDADLSRHLQQAIRTTGGVLK